jgi:hypothetical protein
MGFAALNPSYEYGAVLRFPSPHARSAWRGGSGVGGTFRLRRQ